MVAAWLVPDLPSATSAALLGGVLAAAVIAACLPVRWTWWAGCAVAAIAVVIPGIATWTPWPTYATWEQLVAVITSGAHLNEVTWNQSLTASAAVAAATVTTARSVARATARRVLTAALPCAVPLGAALKWGTSGTSITLLFAACLCVLAATTTAPLQHARFGGRRFAVRDLLGPAVSVAALALFAVGPWTTSAREQGPSLMANGKAVLKAAGETLYASEPGRAVVDGVLNSGIVQRDTTSTGDTAGTDLSGVDLSGLDLSGVDLSGVDLSGAGTGVSGSLGKDTSGLDLSGVDLSGLETSGIGSPGSIGVSTGSGTTPDGSAPGGPVTGLPDGQAGNGAGQLDDDLNTNLSADDNPTSNNPQTSGPEGDGGDDGSGSSGEGGSSSGGSNSSGGGAVGSGDSDSGTSQGGGTSSGGTSSGGTSSGGTSSGGTSSDGSSSGGGGSGGGGDNEPGANQPVDNTKPDTTNSIPTQQTTQQQAPAAPTDTTHTPLLISAAVIAATLITLTALALKKRRNQPATNLDSLDAIFAAWISADRSVGKHIGKRPATATFTERADQVASSLPTASTPFRQLAQLADAALFAGTTGPQQTTDARLYATAVIEAVATQGRARVRKPSV
jgi:hypothetical protein